MDGWKRWNKAFIVDVMLFGVFFWTDTVHEKKTWMLDECLVKQRSLQWIDDGWKWWTKLIGRLWNSLIPKIILLESKLPTEAGEKTRIKLIEMKKVLQNSSLNHLGICPVLISEKSFSRMFPTPILGEYQIMCAWSLVIHDLTNFKFGHQTLTFKRGNGETVKLLQRQETSRKMEFCFASLCWPVWNK